LKWPEIFLSIIMFCLVLFLVLSIIIIVILIKKNRNIKNSKNYHKNYEKIINSAKKKAQKIFFKKEQFFLKQEKILQQNLDNLVKKEKKIIDHESKFLEEKNQLAADKEILIRKLANVSNLSVKNAKKELFLNLKNKFQFELNQKIKIFKQNLKFKSQKIAYQVITDAIEQYSTNFVAEKSISIIKLKNNDIKGKIIGKDGRNIKIFEKKSGVDLIINDVPKIIRISCFNPKRREIAKIALLNLIKDNRIQPNRVEEFLEAARDEFNKTVLELGFEIINDLGFHDVNKGIARYIGYLKYRSSYGQNLLEHSIEVGKLCMEMAKELKLDPYTALKCGFFHDIGKTIDHYNDCDHVENGVKIAQKFNLGAIVLNAIQSHHDDVDANNFYSVLVKAADAISASRPGARNLNYDIFFKKLTEIEKICEEVNGVSKCYALKSGRNIRVMIDSKKIDDFNSYEILEKVKKIILESKIIIPGTILIDVIREFRIKEKFKFRS